MKIIRTLLGLSLAIFVAAPSLAETSPTGAAGAAGAVAPYAAIIAHQGNGQQSTPDSKSGKSVQTNGGSTANRYHYTPHDANDLLWSVPLPQRLFNDVPAHHY